jgi:hypothetical protein
MASKLPDDGVQLTIEFQAQLPRKLACHLDQGTALARKPVHRLKVALMAVRVFQRQGALASTGHARDIGHRPRLLHAMPQLFDLLFASDDERRALGQMYNRRRRRTLTQEPRPDQAEALGLAGPQVEVFLVAQPGDAAVAVENACQLDVLAFYLLPVGVRPFFLHPLRVDRVRRQNQQNEIGVKAVRDPDHDVLAVVDLALIEPDLYVATGLQRVRQVADEGLVLARMG